jgi:hypothetical protein
MVYPVWSSVDRSISRRQNVGSGQQNSITSQLRSPPYRNPCSLLFHGKFQYLSPSCPQARISVNFLEISWSKTPCRKPSRRKALRAISVSLVKRQLATRPDFCSEICHERGVIGGPVSPGCLSAQLSLAQLRPMYLGKLANYDTGIYIRQHYRLFRAAIRCSILLS